MKTNKDTYNIDSYYLHYLKEHPGSKIEIYYDPNSDTFYGILDIELLDMPNQNKEEKK